jgi:hypothetical protein
MTRIVLDEIKFRELVAGRIVRIGEIEIILSDIGWSRMQAAIEQARDPMSLSPYVEQLDTLNHGGHVITYELTQVAPDRRPVLGELRYLVPLVPSPAEPLAAMVPLAPVPILWNAK